MLRLRRELAAAVLALSALGASRMVVQVSFCLTCAQSSILCETLCKHTHKACISVGSVCHFLVFLLDACLRQLVFF